MKYSSYKKFIYWLSGEEAGQLKNTLETRNVKVRMAKGAVCTPLDEFNKISIVAPSVWDEICYRQGSWYRKSEKNGLYLIVSTFKLKGFEDHLKAIISLSDFKPSRLATINDKQELVYDPGFTKEIPSEWSKVNEKDTRMILKWAKKLEPGINNYNDLYLTHTANHANFLNPRFYVKEENTIIPYSIDRSAYLCSCCLEIYQVVGRPFLKKLVAPCAGAVIFARLKADQYLLVERPG